MKSIHLLRHAKSSWKDESLADFDRPLAKRGIRAVQAVAAYMAEHEIQPAQVLCSPSRRTRETLAIIETGLPSAIPVRFEKEIYVAEATALLLRLKRLSDSLSSVLLIGHNPGTERLAQMLIGSGDPATRERIAEKYPTGALAVLSTDVERWRDLVPGSARLEAFVCPKELMSD